MDDVPPINAAVIVLAAGESSRMGRPKALLDWRGKPLIEHVLATARQGGCAGSLVVLGRDAEAIMAGADLGDATVLVNPDPARGQISSIRLGMENLDFSTDCCLVWPVDCPLVRPGDVRALIDAYARWRGALMRIFMPVYQGRRGHPMLVDIGFRQPFMELPPDATARKVLDDNPTQVKEVPTDNPGVLVDMDTPEEYRAALAAL
ncbi:MAG: nucleotidyltransferase family protein [Planctomycetes bacterium]|jgi:CTP:molybdopterin cytidylyltransferase MocA|nr:nucleotidyltransferase family protein [Planctomycetota bacterium]MCL4730442.1 nucleotidyltransferase family protein [Planctomycetota bacterium]